MNTERVSAPDAPEMGLRLEHCGDLLTIEEYTRWARNESIKTTYNQLHRGGCLVGPHAIKPKPVWRRADLQAWLNDNTVIVRQRSARARKKMRLAANQ